MNIAVNTRFLLSNKLEGIGWFTYETLKRITRAHPEHQFHFLFDRPYHNEFIFSGNITPHILPPPARHPLLWYWWFEQSVPSVLKKIKADLFLSTDGFLSLSAPMKQLLVVHDLAYLHYPAHINKSALLYYRFFTPKYIRKAARIATVSEFSKVDICKSFAYPEDKIDVIYNGAHEFFQPLSGQEKDKIRARYTKGAPYFIYAGAIQPRKNITTLFKAYDRLKSEQEVPHKLVIAGRFAWKSEHIKKCYDALKHKDEIIFTGHLGRTELTRIVGAAYAMMYISLFEGFGIPILEAAQCGVPSITSNVSSMPEVCGDSGILISDPENIQEVYEAMFRIITDKDLYHTLCARSTIQASGFSWDKTAQGLWNSIQQTI